MVSAFLSVAARLNFIARLLEGEKMAKSLRLGAQNALQGV